MALLALTPLDRDITLTTLQTDPYAIYSRLRREASDTTIAEDFVAALPRGERFIGFGFRGPAALPVTLN